MAISQITLKYSYIDNFCPDDFVQWISIDFLQNELKRTALQCSCAATILALFC